MFRKKAHFCKIINVESGTYQKYSLVMTLGTNIDEKYAHGAGSTNIYEKNRNIAEAQI